MEATRQGPAASVANAVFGVYLSSDGTEIAEMTTDSDGQVALSLDANTYYLKELQSPYGFLIDPAEIDFTITAGRSVEIEVTDQRDETIPAAPQSNIDMLLTRISCVRTYRNGSRAGCRILTDERTERRDRYSYPAALG